MDELFDLIKVGGSVDIQRTDGEFLWQLLMFVVNQKELMKEMFNYPVVRQYILPLRLSRPNDFLFWSYLLVLWLMKVLCFCDPTHVLISVTCFKLLSLSYFRTNSLSCCIGDQYNYSKCHCRMVWKGRDQRKRGMASHMIPFYIITVHCFHKSSKIFKSISLLCY